MRENLQQYCRFLLGAIVGFLIGMIVIQCYEMSSTSPSAEALSANIFSALAWCAFVCSTVAIIGLIISLVNIRVAVVLSTFFFGFWLLLSFIVTEYFIQSGVLLGTDAFGYTWRDVETTVKSSSEVNILSLVVTIVTLGVFALVTNFIRRVEWNMRIYRSVWAGLVIFLGMVGAFHAGPVYDEFTSESDYLKAVNKPSYFIDRSWKSMFTTSSVEIAASDYYFRKRVLYEDRIGEFFRESDRLPNIVFILVEGLGRDFTGPDAMYGGFTPFLDSLADKTLYWKNGLSNAGRTFGVIPSILGSLPYGNNGFLDYGNDLPDHHTLISLLREYGYSTNLFYGGNPNFDNIDLFFGYHDVKYLLSEANFPSTYQQFKKGGWGFDDREVFNRSIEVLKELNTRPRIDVYLTLTTHEPFQVPDVKFKKQFDKIIESDIRNRELILKDRNVFECLLYTDDAIRHFIRRYEAEIDSTNTIFIITGDHRLIPTPQATRLSRFHVPLMIYSPLLKRNKKFGSLALHSDIPLTLLGYLSNKHGLSFPEKLATISGPVAVETDFNSDVDIALMRNKGEISDYIFQDYYLSQGTLFKIQSNLDLENVNDPEMEDELQAKLKRFIVNNDHAGATNTWDSVGDIKRAKLFFLSAEDSAYVITNFSKTTPDELYQNARQLAFDKDYKHAKACLHYLLNHSPNFHDARILLARAYGWNGKYDSARMYLQQVIQRASTYADAYAALSDIEYWSENLKTSLTAAEDGLKNNPDDVELLCRRARALLAMGRKEDARNLLKDVLTRQPNNMMAIELIKQAG